MRPSHTLIKLAVLALTAAITHAALPARAETQSVLRKDDNQLQPALDLLDQAAQLRLSNPPRSRALAADAAALLNAADIPSAHDNPPFQRALGNAHLLADDLGRAVLAYRRAQDANPADPTIAASLTHARSLLDATVPESRAAIWRRIANAATAQIPRTPVFFTAIAALTIACLLLAARILLAARAQTRPLTWLTPPAVALIALSGIAGAFLAIDAQHSNQPAAVVIASAPARTGPDTDIYPAAFSEPLPPGTEITVQETRDTWARVTLTASSNAEAWIPLRTLESVHPERSRPAPTAPQPNSPTQPSPSIITP